MEIDRTFRIRTLGCKVNQVEGQALREKFMKIGYREATQDTGLDVVVINSCTVTSNADSRSRALIRKFHRLNPQAKILVTGCYAEKNKDEISRLEGVYMVVTQNEKEKLIDRFLNSSPLGEGTSLENENGLTYQDLPISRLSGRTRAFIKIQDGCDRNCSYCKVKVVRGLSRSRPLSGVLEESNQRLVSRINGRRSFPRHHRSVRIEFFSRDN